MPCRGSLAAKTHELMVWERVEWRQGDGRYLFEVAQGGLYGTITAPQGATLTLPIVAWEGLLDALAAACKTKARTERSLPSRTGVPSESEAQESGEGVQGRRLDRPARPGSQPNPIHPRSPARAARPLGFGGNRGPCARRCCDPPPAPISAYPTVTTGYPSSAAIRSSGPAPVPDKRQDADPQPPFGKVNAHQRLPAGPEPSRFNRDVRATQKPGASAPVSDRREGTRRRPPPPKA